MSEGPLPTRLAVEWTDEAKRQLRAIDRSTALDLLYCTDRYLRTREGDVKRLQAPLTGFRLRCGDYRVFFIFIAESAIRVTSVRNRREAYRS